MDRTTRSLLIWGSLGCGVALSVSGHRRMGFLVGLTALTVAVTSYPRGSYRALKAMPKAMRIVAKVAWKAGKATGEAIGRSAA